MKEIGEPVPVSFILNDMAEIDEAINVVGLPAIVRPAYTLGGAGGGIASDKRGTYPDRRTRAEPGPGSTRY